MSFIPDAEKSVLNIYGVWKFYVLESQSSHKRISIL